MPQAFYPLPNNRAGNPDGGSIHELAAPKMHSQMCHHTAGELLPHLLTLAMMAVIFFCITQPSRTACKLASGMPFAARTFLSCSHKAAPATDCPAAFRVQR